MPLPHTIRPFVYCDVGARSGISLPWASLLTHLSVVGFEPEPEEYARLLASKRPQDSWLNYALADADQTLTLYLTKNRACSSIYQPNLEFLQQFPDVERFAIEEQIRLPAVKLDTLWNRGEIKALDFVKIDTQGAELAILRGGQKFLSAEAVGLEVEVEFSEMYEGQPLFADVDSWVRNSLGLQLHDLRCNYWKLKTGIDTGSVRGQVVFGDALYLRPVGDLPRWLADRPSGEIPAKCESVLMAATVYGYPDYAVSVLRTNRGLLPAEVALRWEQFLNGYSRSIRSWKHTRNWGQPFGALAALFQGSVGGWASSDRPLGARKRWGWFQ